MLTEVEMNRKTRENGGAYALALICEEKLYEYLDEIIKTGVKLQLEQTYQQVRLLRFKYHVLE